MAAGSRYVTWAPSIQETSFPLLRVLSLLGRHVHRAVPYQQLLFCRLFTQLLLGNGPACHTVWYCTQSRYSTDHKWNGQPVQKQVLKATTCTCTIYYVTYQGLWLCGNSFQQREKVKVGCLLYMRVTTALNASLTFVLHISYYITTCFSLTWPSWGVYALAKIVALSSSYVRCEHVIFNFQIFKIFKRS
jgi:hypothetical protein